MRIARRGRWSLGIVFAATAPWACIQATDIELGELSGPGATGFSSDTLLCDVHYRDDSGSKSDARSEALLYLRLRSFSRHRSAIQSSSPSSPRRHERGLTLRWQRNPN